MPHFEKMLYDNAQLIDMLSIVWRATRNPLYRARIDETVGWSLREMLVEGGASPSSLDADSEGEEGKFYVWTEAEVDEVLGNDATLFKQVYDVDRRRQLGRPHDPASPRHARTARCRRRRASSTRCARSCSSRAPSACSPARRQGARRLERAHDRRAGQRRRRVRPRRLAAGPRSTPSTSSVSG